MTGATLTKRPRALVTGGSGEIGGAIALALAEAGHEVLIHARAQLHLAGRLAGRINAAGGAAQPIGFDLEDGEATAAILEGSLAAGPIQMIVHAAGIHDDAPLAGMTGRQWRSVLAVSLDGFFNVTRPLLLPMLATRWGRIVAISSVSAILGNRGQANYAAAKAGLHGAVRSLAREVGSRGITVNAVAPGVIASAATAPGWDAERIAAMVPAKRAGTPQEVAAVVRFLCSAEAAYVSGQVIAVDGGLS